MFKFECKDMGMDCDYVATAASKEEVMDMAMTHAVETHADVLQGLTQEQTVEMNAKLASVISETETEELVAENDAVAGNDNVVDGDDDDQGEEDGDDEDGEDAVSEDPEGDDEDQEDSEEKPVEVA